MDYTALHGKPAEPPVRKERPRFPAAADGRPGMPDVRKTRLPFGRVLIHTGAWPAPGKGGQIVSFPVSAALMDAVVLAVVSREETYGYRITQDVRAVMEVSESALYPVLRRLQREGLLRVYDRAYAGRNRRYYQITPAGHSRLEESLREWQDFKEKMDYVFYGGGQG